MKNNYHDLETWKPLFESCISTKRALLFKRFTSSVWRIRFSADRNGGGK